LATSSVIGALLNSQNFDIEQFYEKYRNLLVVAGLLDVANYQTTGTQKFTSAVM
jgi:hypothetical protein